MARNPDNQDVEVDEWSTALAKIPEGQTFRVRQKSGQGRPRKVENDGEDEWNHTQFRKAMRDGALEAGGYSFIPIVAGQASKKRFSFSLEEDQLSVGTVGDPAQREQALMGSTYLQADVVDLFRGRWVVLEAKLEEAERRLRKKDRKIHGLKMEIAALKTQMSQASEGSGLEKVGTKILEAHATGPLGRALIARLLSMDPALAAGG